MMVFLISERRTISNNNNNNNNKVKDKYTCNCYDYDYKLNTIRKQRSLNHSFDHSQKRLIKAVCKLIKMCDKSYLTTL